METITITKEELIKLKQEMYNLGYKDGNEAGLTDGYEDGHTAGYDEGFNAAIEQALIRAQNS